MEHMKQKLFISYLKISFYNSAVMMDILHLISLFSLF